MSTTTIAFPELDELEGKLAAKRKAGNDFLAEARSGNAEVIDLSLVKSVNGTNLEKAAWFQELQAELNDLEDKARKLRPLADHADGFDDDDLRDRVERSGRRAPKQKSLAELFIAEERQSVKQFRHDFNDFDVKRFLNATMTTSSGWGPDVVREPTVIAYAVAPIELLDRIPTSRTTQTAVTYMEETTRTNAAAERNEGAAKAESTLVLTERTETVRSVATSIAVTDEQLEDVDEVDTYLNQRLPEFLRERLEQQIISGDGTAPNLSGILDRAIQTQAKGADPTPDAVYKAMTKVRTVGFATPDTVVFHPNDWQDVRLLRTLDGIYIWGNPSEAGPERIWGLPVVQVNRATENTAIVGAFRTFCALRVKKGITVERGFINDDFTKDITRLRAETRVVFVVYRPAAFCSVTGI